MIAYLVLMTLWVLLFIFLIGRLVIMYKDKNMKTKVNVIITFINAAILIFLGYTILKPMDVRTETTEKDMYISDVTRLPKTDEDISIIVHLSSEDKSFNLVTYGNLDDFYGLKDRVNEKVCVEITDFYWGNTIVGNDRKIKGEEIGTKTGIIESSGWGIAKFY